MSSFLNKVKLSIETIKDVTKDAINGEELLASPELSEKRLDECKKCPNFVEQFGTPRCNKCGCFMKLKNKLASAKCPIGKW